MDVVLTQRALFIPHTGKAKIPTVARIQQAVASFYHIRPMEMVSQRRSREVARPRQVAMYLARELTPHSLPQIGRFFGNRDHTTVMHAIKRVEEFIALDWEFSEDVEDLRDRLTPEDAKTVDGGVLDHPRRTQLGIVAG